MRGKRYWLKHDGAFSGITPADAGKTFWKVNGYGNLEDHPRGCGENNILPLLDTAY